MSIPVPIEYRMETRHKGTFNALYGALLIFSLHWAMVIYANSSYLTQFVSPRTLGTLYVTSAVLTIGLFLYAPRLLSRFGNIRLITFFTVTECVALLGMAYTHAASFAILFFIAHQAIVPIILYFLDLCMEELIGTEEGTTGSRRGMLLTIMSLTSALGSLYMGKLLGAGIPNFSFVYTTSALALLPFLYIMLTQFKNFAAPVRASFNIAEGINNFWQYKDVRNVFFAHFLLQLFFAWMVMYTPVYLSTVMAFNWEEIGIILFSGLMAYVFLEYVIGVVADNYIGEKEMMAFGFTIISIATSWFVFLDNTSVIVWMAALFMTRVGASFVETTTESYFFKHTEERDANVISLFRITRPLAYVLGAILGGLTLRYLPFELLFVVLGVMMLPGLFFAMVLHDTK